MIVLLVTNNLELITGRSIGERIRLILTINLIIQLISLLIVFRETLSFFSLVLIFIFMLISQWTNVAYKAVAMVEEGKRAEM